MARSRMMGVAAVLALGGSAVLPLGSCVDDSVSIHIDCIVPPEDDCTYSADGDSCYSGGVLNFAAGASYDAALRVVNGLTPRARTSPPAAEPNGFTVTGFDVHLLEVGGQSIDFGALSNPFFAPSSHYAEPNGGKTAALAELVPPQYGQILETREKGKSPRGSILVQLRVRATTDGARDITSAKLTFPLSFSNVSLDPALPTPACTVSMNAVCTLGRDKYANACDPILVAAMKAGT